MLYLTEYFVQGCLLLNFSLLRHIGILYVSYPVLRDERTFWFTCGGAMWGSMAFLFAFAQGMSNLTLHLLTQSQFFTWGLARFIFIFFYTNIAEGISTIQLTTLPSFRQEYVLGNQGITCYYSLNYLNLFWFNSSA